MGMLTAASPRCNYLNGPLPPKLVLSNRCPADHIHYIKTSVIFSECPIKVSLEKTKPLDDLSLPYQRSHVNVALPLRSGSMTLYNWSKTSLKGELLLDPQVIFLCVTAKKITHRSVRWVIDCIRVPLERRDTSHDRRQLQLAPNIREAIPGHERQYKEYCRLTLWSD